MGRIFGRKGKAPQAKQESKIKAMQDWAEKEQITHTPTIFINGYELPSAYAVEDLNYVLQ